MTNFSQRLGDHGLGNCSIALQALRDGREPNVTAATDELVAHFEFLLDAQELVSRISAGTLTRTEAQKLCDYDVAPITERSGGTG